MPSDNPLRAYFEQHEGPSIHKWLHYFDVYDRHFSKYRGRPVTVLEFGVLHGGSLQMWRDYFGPEAVVHGVDIDPQCADLADGTTKIFIGDQEDREFLRSVMAEIGTVDVVIEDGGHWPRQQIATFEECYPSVATDGVFLVEDLHTNYWERFEGGLGRDGTFIEYAKRLSDQLNAWHSRDDAEFVVDDFTRTTRSMHFYDSIIVFEKRDVRRPRSRRSGHETIDKAQSKRTIRGSRSWRRSGR